MRTSTAFFQSFYCLIIRCANLTVTKTSEKSMSFIFFSTVNAFYSFDKDVSQKVQYNLPFKETVENGM